MARQPEIDDLLWFWPQGENPVAAPAGSSCCDELASCARYYRFRLDWTV